MVGVQIGYGKMEQLLEQVLRPQHQTQSTTIAILNPMFAQHCIGHSSTMLSHSEISYEGHLSKTFDVEEKNELLRIGLLKKMQQTNKQEEDELQCTVCLSSPTLDLTKECSKYSDIQLYSKYLDIRIYSINNY